MKMEQLVIFDFVGKQEFQNYVENRLANDFAFHLANSIIRKEKEIVDKEKCIDELVEALEMMVDGYSAHDLVDMTGFTEKECQTKIIDALEKAKS